MSAHMVFRNITPFCSVKSVNCCTKHTCGNQNTVYCTSYSSLQMNVHVCCMPWLYCNGISLSKITSSGSTGGRTVCIIVDLKAYYTVVSNHKFMVVAIAAI